MATLRVTADYSAGPVAYTAGSVIDVPDEFADFLLRDSPGSFERVRPQPADAHGDASATRPAPRGRMR